MIKIITLLLITFSVIGCANAGDIYNTTNVIGAGLCPEIVGGTNVVTLHPHYLDHWFSLYNDGGVTYQVYAYDYIGLRDPPYKAAFIGAIEPNQIGVLNNNASYYIYADYDAISDLTDTEKIKYKFNQWWIYIFIGAILVFALVLIIKKVLR